MCSYCYPPVPDGTTYGTSTTIYSATSTLPCELRYWTWREAIEVASRLHETDTDGRRPTLRREGDQWVVRYNARLHLINTA